MDDIPLSVIPAWEWVGIVFCVAFSSFFSAAETALTALPFAKAKQIMDDRGRNNLILDLWLHKPNRILTTILIGNNLFNIGASALATDMAQKLFKNNGVAVAVGVMTFILLVFGEITPKTLAKRHSEKFSIFFTKALLVPYYVFLPLSVVLVNLIRGLVRLTGGDIIKDSPLVKVEDIEYLIELGGEEGVLESERKEMLSGIFEFADTVVREIMIPRTDMVLVKHDATFEDVLKIIVEAGHSRLPVYEDTADHISGLVYAKDLLKFINSKNGKSMILSDFLRAPFYVPETKKISELLADFKKQRIHMAIVVDEYGGTAGLITLEDILEEIVGEIHDEYDSDEKIIRALDDGSFVCDAKIDIEELEEHLHMTLPDDEGFESLGGYLISILGRIPKKGEHCKADGLHMIILDADDTRILKVKITKIQDEATENTDSANPK